MTQQDKTEFTQYLEKEAKEGNVHCFSALAYIKQLEQALKPFAEEHTQDVFVSGDSNEAESKKAEAERLIHDLGKANHSSRKLEERIKRLVVTDLCSVPFFTTDVQAVLRYLPPGVSLFLTMNDRGDFLAEIGSKKEKLPVFWGKTAALAASAAFVDCMISR
jgi:hypothetical protein